MSVSVSRATRVSHAVATVADHVALTKPRVVSLLVVTGVCGYLAGAAGHVQIAVMLAVAGGGALAAGGANALNCAFDRDLDAVMARTRSRPIPGGRVPVLNAVVLGIAMNVAAALWLDRSANLLAAALALAGTAWYLVVYTAWLKRRSTQNIVIGGAAGCFPPLVGWAAATGTLDATALTLAAVIFLWTPPHFWALATLLREDYRRANIPMLPAVVSVQRTANQAFVYAVATVGVSLDAGPVGRRGRPVHGERRGARRRVRVAGGRRSGATRTVRPPAGSSATRSSTWRRCSWRSWWIGCSPDERAPEGGTHDEGDPRPLRPLHPVPRARPVGRVGLPELQPGPASQPEPDAVPRDGVPGRHRDAPRGRRLVDDPGLTVRLRVSGVRPWSAATSRSHPAAESANTIAAAIRIHGLTISPSAMITAAIANPNGQIVGRHVRRPPPRRPLASGARRATIRETTPRKQNVADATSSSVAPPSSWLVSP